MFIHTTRLRLFLFYKEYVGTAIVEIRSVALAHIPILYSNSENIVDQV